MDIIDQTGRYLDKIPPAVSGAGGHNQTFASLAFSSRVGLSNAGALNSIFRTSKNLELRNFMTVVAKGKERNLLLGGPTEPTETERFAKGGFPQGGFTAVANDFAN